MLILSAIKLSSEASVNKIYIGERVRRLADLSREHLRDVEKKTKQMRPNQLRAILIFLITPASALQFAGYPCTTGTQKPPKISNKNSSFNWVHSIIMRSMSAPHSTYLFTNSCHHISTNGKASPSTLPYNTPQFLYSLLRRAYARNVSFLNLSHWKFNLYQLSS